MFMSLHICSPDMIKSCIKGKIEVFCANKTDNFKCKIFERCKDTQNETITGKKQCIKEFCEEPDNTDKFECQALQCKNNYRIPPRKLNCIKEACIDEENVRICQKISQCEAENPGPLLGKIKVFKCLLNNVFDGIAFD